MAPTNLLPHITHYRIIDGLDAEKLHVEIEKAIDDGWQPFGSLAVDRGYGGVYYAQPMVRYAEFHR